MSTTTTVPNDVATLHALVVTEAFTGQSHMGFATPPYPVGFVLQVQMLGQTNVHAGQGPRHPKAALIEVPAGTKAGAILTEAEVATGIATAKEKQALVPEQQKAREAQRQTAAAAAAKVVPDLTARVAALEAKVK